MREISYNKKGTFNNAMLDGAEKFWLPPNHRCVRWFSFILKL